MDSLPAEKGIRQRRGIRPGEGRLWRAWGRGGEDIKGGNRRDSLLHGNLALRVKLHLELHKAGGQKAFC